MEDSRDRTYFDFDGSGPVRPIPGDAGLPPIDENGIGLCLSGGGYRAMLFHLGTLWRLNQFGLLPRLARISSVSGGSITSGVLAYGWQNLSFDSNGQAVNFDQVVARPLFHLAQHTIDLPAIGGGLLPFVSAADILIHEYDHYLYGGATLQALPDPRPHTPAQTGAPEFVFNATNLQSLALWRFSKDAMRDWRVGQVLRPNLRISQAVAASSAFPPVLSPLILKFDEGVVQDMPGTDLHKPPYTTKVVLSDGGVYDNMGLETVWKRYRNVLVSDAGGKMSPVPNPHTDWAMQGFQVLSMGDNQVRNLRKREVVGSFAMPPGQQAHRNGSYWSIRSDPAKYPNYTSPFPMTSQEIDELALTPTRLAGLDDGYIKRLVNWGYIMADIALQSWFSSHLPVCPTPTLPY